MPDQERELTPQQEAEIRRLLGEARATEPVPDEVAARLDRVLVGLGEDRGGAPSDASGAVVALASRRRRASYLLVAAAAVVAVGIGLGQVVGDTSGSDADTQGAATDTGAAADRESPQEDGVTGAAPIPEATDGVELGSGASAPPQSETRAGRVREASFTADANQLRRALPDTAVDGEFVQLTADQLPSGYVLGPRAFDCAPAHWGHGVLVPVYFDGTPAVLAYRPVTGESQVVDLLQCGTGKQLRSTTLQAG